MKTWFIERGDVYPVTIVTTRYGGAYEKGAWAAFPLVAEDLPEDWNADDFECQAFWQSYTGCVGIGATPAEAHARLYEAVCQYEEDHPSGDA